MKTIKVSRQERHALHRLSIIGHLLAMELSRGELKEELLRLSQLRYLPPDAKVSRQYHYKTLERWYYQAKAEAMQGLLPKSRRRGSAQKLNPEQRELMVQMREEHPSAAAELLRSEAERHGVVAEGTLTDSTLRRLYREAGTPRQSKRKAERGGEVQRRRWQAANPGDLWHGDVCHLLLADERGKPRRVLVHGLLDDASRYIVALMPKAQEREEDMLEVLCGALLKYPTPRVLYLDNGSCYRGDALQVVCQRLGIRLVHATPYSPEARGKMERFWRTLRQRCTDHLPPTADGATVANALWAWLDTDYQCRPHAGLMGNTPRRRYLEHLTHLGAPLTPQALARAMETETTRKVRQDSTFTLEGQTYEVSGRHLAGKTLNLTLDALTGTLLKVTWNQHPVRFALCHAVANRSRRRASEPATPKAPTIQSVPRIPFDPIGALLQKAREEHDDE